jgi:hypothetical protein
MGGAMPKHNNRTIIMFSIPIFSIGWILIGFLFLTGGANIPVPVDALPSKSAVIDTSPANDQPLYTAQPQDASAQAATTQQERTRGRAYATQPDMNAETTSELATASETDQEAGSNPPRPGETKPLSELTRSTYLGFSGGLYPAGKNVPPAAHAQEGITRMEAVQPLDAQGRPSANGEIVLLSIGMSHTLMEFCGKFVIYTRCEPYSFIGQALVDPAVNHSTLYTINGARGSQVASDWVSPTHENYDRIRDAFLAPFGLSEQQVQVVWVKLTDFILGRPSLPAQNAQAFALTTTLAEIMRTLKIRYPHLQQVFLSSRIYGGYASGGISPEPYAYETGFSVKWLIEAQIDQMATGQVNNLTGDLNYDTVSPWLAWGPYTWANGTTPRREDGLVWLPQDFEDDGSHPSISGRTKVANMLLSFFKTSPFTECWFLADPDC